MRNLFRKLGLLEALSFIVLVGVAMPLKYKFGILDATRIPGMAHGLLFIAYVALAFQRSDAENWPKSQLSWALLASVLPFGTLVFDWKFLRERADAHAAFDARSQ